MCISEDNLLLASLSDVQCPFEKDTSVVLCSFYEHNSYCPFAHKTDKHHSSVSPILLPPFICLNHLVGQCNFPLFNTSETVCDDEKWTICLGGIHLTWIQLLKIDLIKPQIMNMKRKVHRKRLVAQLPCHKCAICLDTIESRWVMYAIPQNCCHIFCAGCLFRWVYEGRNTCPTCRTVFTNVLFWSISVPIPEGDAKRKAFQDKILFNVKFTNDPDTPAVFEQPEAQANEHGVP